MKTIKVAFCTKPLHSGHSVRGVGYYARNILENLKSLDDVEVEEFEDISKIKKADVVHYPWFDLFNRTLPINKRFPTIVTVHDVIPLLYPDQYPPGIKGRLNFALQKIALISCKYIITVSEASKKDIENYLKVRKEKIIVTYEAANENFKIQPDSKQLKIRRKFNLPERFLLYVGDANFNKNTPMLIEGFRKLKSLPEFKDLKLVLIGNVFLKKPENINHPELESLKKTLSLITEYKLENEVIIPGQLETDELAAVYNLALVYVQPSLYEGFGLPVLEAMSCGVPVVSSDSPALKEIGGEAVVYFNPKDLNSFVDCLKSVLQNRSIQDKLSKSGLNRASRFSWENTADETIKVYKQSLQ
ncbi:hypothetical protein A3F00_02330 [Candidatus Daviesbacteria bacterium RIFCSPHIGHO2_12_FULL_37_11]|uniref:Glycosyl transferase family 1 domain-containing protein n=1 Tax=Candidatus Daviesbacteria bacterium RIFCSPHIGHO2_12_FULL_37_11 TaxID=1797777 RepID=A0A1F5K8J0_9BACT|nr:MAG: hypothetical protein A3F00_02330 [Candidatus Daviesbacteria bacterium RIFCSPHIGHO2_12_FULL_37_11]OGE46092.1 MAG: hypothetical protein A3B39_00785 [Candidatus Daviesbacteria bacterium RIFCSPLOWO2_01_FULL_37_10]